MKKTLPIATALLALAASSAQAADAVVSSPDGRVALRIADDGSSFSVTRRGEAVIATSPLGLELDGPPALGALALESRQDTMEDRVIPLVATKAASARDHYRGATLTFREVGGERRRLLIDTRAYDDGVAFRYRIEGAGPVLCALCVQPGRVGAQPRGRRARHAAVGAVEEREPARGG